LPPPADAGNYHGTEAGGATYKGYINDRYRDGAVRTSPVGKYRPNKHGIYDLGGNVDEWCEDKYHADQTWRVYRGASWAEANLQYLLASTRRNNGMQHRSDRVGFRVVVARSPR
jgi:formylglycine-generating enzyme required for sulfatase activity